MRMRDSVHCSCNWWRGYAIIKINMEKNVLLKIAYDGSGFHGWQRQPDRRTVQGHLEQTMSRLFNREIILNGTSRTDAGVHALGQRASFKAELGIPTEKIAMVVNNALCAREGSESSRGRYAKSPVRILEACEVPPEFHARFDCRGKEYIYRMRDGLGAESFENDMSLVFERNYVYHVKELLDVEAMNKAAGTLVGTHDFKSFEASGGNPRETTVRTIFSATAARTKDGGRNIEVRIKGDGFLYNMVRIITGTLVEIGQGRRDACEMEEILNAADRTEAGHTAPPGGLYLSEIYY